MFIGNRKRAVKIAMIQRVMETRTAIVKMCIRDRSLSIVAKFVMQTATSFSIRALAIQAAR